MVGHLDRVVTVLAALSLLVWSPDSICYWRDLIDELKRGYIGSCMFMILAMSFKALFTRNTLTWARPTKSTVSSVNASGLDSGPG